MIEYWVPALSSFAKDIDFVFDMIFWIVIAFWFLLVEGVFLWLILRFKKRDGVPAQYITGELKSEKNWVHYPHLAVLACDVVPAPEAVARPLALEPGAPVQKAQRVRSTREGPFSHITTWVPAALAAGFGRRELAKQPILLLLEAQGVRIGRAEQSISARLADAEVARHLQVEVGSALLAVHRLIFDVDERPVQWLQGLYRPDRYQYRMQLSRVGGIDAKVWVSKELSAQFH